ncbi:hypothetical protein Q757_06550, partial [Oenococcus alcoholitolerans]
SQCWEKFVRFRDHLLYLKKSYEASLKNEGLIHDRSACQVMENWFDGANLPRPEQIGAKLDLIDPEQVVFNDKKRAVKLQLTGMEIDLGAIAKGYIADAVKNFWQRSGILSGIINLGGNILLVGSSRHGHGRWQIGVQDPFKIKNLPLGILTDLRDCSVVTSGIYERYLKLNGMFYHHMFDSKTGYPIKNDLSSVTIVSKNRSTLIFGRRSLFIMVQKRA